MAAVVRADYVSGASGSETYTSAETGAVDGTTAAISGPATTTQTVPLEAVISEEIRTFKVHVQFLGM